MAIETPHVQVGYKAQQQQINQLHHAHHILHKGSHCDKQVTGDGYWSTVDKMMVDMKSAE